MKTVAIIPCTNQKTEASGLARKVWKGSHFQLTLLHAELYYDLTFIMSYKYGLISPNFEIEPYDLDMREAPLTEKVQWWWMMAEHIKKLCLEEKPDLIGLYTGTFERDRIIREFVRNDLDNIAIPWEGLGIGERMQTVYDNIAPFTKEDFKKGTYKIVLEKKTLTRTKPMDLEWEDDDNNSQDV